MCSSVSPKLQSLQILSSCLIFGFVLVPRLTSVSKRYSLISVIGSDQDRFLNFEFFLEVFITTESPGCANVILPCLKIYVLGTFEEYI